MITFNGKKETDFEDVWLNDRVIESPSKKVIQADVPFANSVYDFSTIATNGEPIYTQRKITSIFGVKAISKAKLQVLYSEIMAWLFDIGGQQQLIFDDMIDYYFTAYVLEAPSWEEVVHFGKFTVVFVAEPFKAGVNYEGSDIWDTFNFEQDKVQDTEFDVSGSKTVTITNVGRLVCPTINVNASMSIVFNSKTYNLVAGDNKFYDLKLASGDNSITINGNGHIKFLFRKSSI